ncbi:peptidase U32 [Methanobacterium lacus]|uniref:Peptidase U32 n=1 Tax=Methanobacterium lacus (strain AL-21) TaxID=877455 RepID=F0T9L9_METLA|nr:U32 family peptidase [Methanobacterium lacus]ADZ08767.1 peptidase U32 [Methanobacterium lacus]
MAIKEIPELLAPAGSLNSLIAAVNAGADAVYISGKKFGARRFASNFTKEEMLEGLKYAKLRNVKVYITVNTLMKDFQLKTAIEYIFWLYKNGADAIIVQDLGLARLCREIIPEMKLHASTQLTIHNSAGVKWATEFGFKRIVLARELKITEVKTIVETASKNKVEIEIFGHGALCYSYSGQCLLSSFIGGRSGNRGVCAQPCRKAYKLVSGKKDKYDKPIETHISNISDKFLLSTQDLCVYSQLEKIVGSNINSLKIEGRMRSQEYVAIVINIYRKALDSLKSGKWSSNKENLSKLILAFNRGFSSGYLLKSDGETIMGRDAPGNRGLYIGDVVGYSNKTKVVTIKVKNRFKIGKGDGVVFRESNQTIQTKHNLKESMLSEGAPVGMAIEEDPVYKGNILKFKVKKPLNRNSMLYLTRSLALNHEASDIIKNVKSPSIPMDMMVSLDGNMAVKIEGSFQGLDGHKHCLTVLSDFKMENAINKPLTADKIIGQLNKTGKTNFVIGKLDIDIPETLFTPISNLNKVRRDFFEAAEAELIKTFKPGKNEVLRVKNRIKENMLQSTGSPSKFVSNHSCVLGAYLDSVDGLKGALEGGVKRAYFEPVVGNNLVNCTLKSSKFSEDEKNQISSQLLDAIKLCQEFGAEFIWKWPQITHDSLIHKFLDVLGSIPEISAIMVDGHGAGEALNSIEGVSLSCSGGFNVWNKETLTTLSRKYSVITVSPELSREDLKNLVEGSRVNGVENPIDMVVQGNLDALISRDCLMEVVSENLPTKDRDFWGIEDEKNHIFPVKIDLNGNTHILNSVELCLIDHVKELVDMGVSGLVMDMRTKVYEYSKEMSLVYSAQLNHVLSRNDSKKMLKQYKSKIKAISTGGITTGNYLKGVKDVQ